MDPPQQRRIDLSAQVGRQDDDPPLVLEPLEQMIRIEIRLATAEQRVGFVEQQNRAPS